MSVQLGNLVITANKKTSFPAPNEGVKAIIIGNESPLTVTITMESGGVQKTLYPSTLDWFTVNNGFTGNILINPIAILNNTGQWPSSSLVFDAIGNSDLENANMYPVSFNRGVNIGNNVGLGTAATSIVNDGNAANTPIVEATVTGDGASAVKITNDAKVTLGSVTNPGSLTLQGPATLATTLAVTGNTTVGKLLLATGTITRLSIFSGTGVAGGVVVNHNLGTTPDFIMFMYVGNFGVSPGHPIWYNSLTSTTVKVIADDSYAFVAMAIKQ